VNENVISLLFCLQAENPKIRGMAANGVVFIDREVREEGRG